MTTTDRLQQYYSFDETITERLTQIAADQNERTFDELVDEFSLADGPRRVSPEGDGRVLEYVLFTPKGDYDESKARVLYNPLATPVNESTVMRAGRLFATDPSEQLMVVGNPGPIGYTSDHIKKLDMPDVYTGNFYHLVQPSLSKLIRLPTGDRISRVTSIDVLGYSLGAELGATALDSAIYRGTDIHVERAVLAEPIIPTQPGLRYLAGQFWKAGKLLDKYVEAAGSAPLLEARRRSDTGLGKYVLGLARPTNLAVMHGISEPKFATRLENAMYYQRDTKVVVAYGSHSEITDSTLVAAQLQSLPSQHQARIQTMELQGMHHAGGDDIDLHAAIMLQGLRSATRIAEN